MADSDEPIRDRLNRLGDKMRNEFQKNVLLQHVSDDLRKRSRVAIEASATLREHSRDLRKRSPKKK